MPLSLFTFSAQRFRRRQKLDSLRAYALDYWAPSPMAHRNAFVEKTPLIRRATPDWVRFANRRPVAVIFHEAAFLSYANAAATEISRSVALDGSVEIV
jgi:hypothetical protein